MKKIRILALLIAVLAIPVLMFISCNNDTDAENECADGHTWNKKETTIEKRTCTESGIKERTCKVCGIKEQYEWKASGHAIDTVEWQYDDDATCLEDGHESRTCLLCNWTETRVKENTALGHNYVTYKLSSDGYSETAVCDRCSESTHTRIVGMNVDFDGDKTALSYGALGIYTADGTTGLRDTDVKTEGTGAALNSYLRIERDSKIHIGNTGYGVLLKPGYQTLSTNKYVVEFDIRLYKNATEDVSATGDLVLLCGNKSAESVNFLKYNSKAHAIETVDGVLYDLQSEDFGRWLKISVVFNDVERNYEVYIDNKLAITGVDFGDNDYYIGAALESFKIGMTHKNGEASCFDIDSIDVYIGFEPKGYEGKTLKNGYAAYTTDYSKDKIMYKRLDSECEHDLNKMSVNESCISDGYKYNECSKCHGCTDFETLTGKTGHDMASTPYKTKEATCTEYGANYFKCKNDGCTFRDYKIIDKKDHVMDTEAASYRNVPATCIANGYISGECKNCHCELADFNGEYKYGHNIQNIQVVQIANCNQDGYSTGVCVNPGCGTRETVDEVAAYGHTMRSDTVIKDGETVIQNTCIRCGQADTENTQKLYVAGDAYPTLSEMKTVLGVKLYGGVDGDGFTKASFETTSKNTQMRFTSDSSSSVAERAIENIGSGKKNTYLHITQNGNDGYVNYLDSNRNKNADIVVELSLRVPSDTSKIPTGTMSAAQRISGHNVVFNVFKLQEDGSILFLPGNCIIGTLSSERFIKLSFVIKPGKGTVDAYFDGELKVQNCLMKSGQLAYYPEGGVIYEYRLLFGGYSDLLGNTKEIDVDDMYMYEASTPVYVTKYTLSDSAGVNYDTANNKTDTLGETSYLYIDKKNSIGSKAEITNGEQFRAYFEKITDTAISQSGEITVLRCLNGTNANYSIGNGNTSTVNTAADILKNSNAVIYNQIKLNEGSFTGENMNAGEIVLAAGNKVTSSGGSAKCNFLVLRDGKLYSGDGRELCKASKNTWITYEVLVNELNGTYDIYINGENAVSGVLCNADYATSDKKFQRCGYTFMSVESGDFDFYMANTALYAGAIAPKDKIKNSVAEEDATTKAFVENVIPIVTFSSENVDSYYDYVGKLVYDGSQITELAGDGYAKKEALGIETLDGKTVLKASNFKSGNLKKIEFKYLTGAKLSNSFSAESKNIVYDLSGYDYITVTFNAEAVSEGGYNVIFKLNAETGYYAAMYRVTATGEYTLKLPLHKNTGNPNTPYFKNNGANGKLTDIVSLSIEFAGKVIGNGNGNNEKIGAGNGNGALMDGTTVSFESISLETDTEVEIELAAGVDIERFSKCKGHKFEEHVVPPTATSKGYTKCTCKEEIEIDGKKYVCGYVMFKDIKLQKEANSAVTVGEENSCLKDYIVIERFVCGTGADGEQYYVITSATPAKAHDLENGKCNGCQNGLAGYVPPAAPSDPSGTEGGNTEGNE